MTAKADCRKSKRSETRPDGVGSVFEAGPHSPFVVGVA